MNEALEVGAQICDALARAHGHGIRAPRPQTRERHADADVEAAGLRPGEVEAPEPGCGVGASALSTQGPATTPGAVVGTVPYMAPEQLEGKESDARTDLFAFGCVLYEMLTGRRAFAGESEASVISAIMTSEPRPLSSLQPATPPALDRLARAASRRTLTSAARAHTISQRICARFRSSRRRSPAARVLTPARQRIESGSGVCHRSCPRRLRRGWHLVLARSPDPHDADPEDLRQRGVAILPSAVPCRCRGRKRVRLLGVPGRADATRVASGRDVGDLAADRHRKRLAPVPVSRRQVPGFLPRQQAVEAPPGFREGR